MSPLSSTRTLRSSLHSSQGSNKNLSHSTPTSRHNLQNLSMKRNSFRKRLTDSHSPSTSHHNHHQHNYSSTMTKVKSSHPTNELIQNLNPTTEQKSNSFSEGLNGVHTHLFLHSDNHSNTPSPKGSMKVKTPLMKAQSSSLHTSKDISDSLNCVCNTSTETTEMTSLLVAHPQPSQDITTTANV